MCLTSVTYIGGGGVGMEGEEQRILGKKPVKTEVNSQGNQQTSYLK